ncbi:MAG: DUF2085 domain-containing protein [Lachnospiraceae bacterium]|nr:DUF2085 domain-containing protein [Lachnospiraceae bacterium]
MNIETNNPTLVIWKALMSWGESLGCHQMPERSFFLRGYQFPVCARCTGVIIGYILAVPIYYISGFHRNTSIFGCFSMLTDWGIQKIRLMESTNTRRFLTGLIGGFGLMSIQIEIIRCVIQRLESWSIQK